VKALYSFEPNVLCIRYKGETGEIVHCVMLYKSELYGETGEIARDRDCRMPMIAKAESYEEAWFNLEEYLLCKMGMQKTFMKFLRSEPGIKMEDA
jgi:hypothetical protein